MAERRADIRMTTFTLSALEKRAQRLDPDIGNGLRERIRTKATKEWSDGDYAVVMQAVARLLSTDLRSGGIIEVRHPATDEKVTVFIDMSPAKAKSAVAS
jgi:hypothetical protein